MLGLGPKGEARSMGPVPDDGVSLGLREMRNKPYVNACSLSVFEFWLNFQDQDYPDNQCEHHETFWFQLKRMAKEDKTYE